MKIRQFHLWVFTVFLLLIVASGSSDVQNERTVSNYVITVFSTPGSYLTREKSVYWDGRNSAGESITSGVYFYSLKAGDFVATRKMVILK